MKHFKLLRSFFFAAAAVTFGSTQAQIAISPGPVPATPKPKAMLDLDDVTRGFLAYIL